MSPRQTTRGDFNVASTAPLVRDTAQTPGAARVRAMPGARKRQKHASKPQHISLDGLRGPLAGASSQRALREKWFWNSYP